MSDQKIIDELNESIGKLEDEVYKLTSLISWLRDGIEHFGEDEGEQKEYLIARINRELE